MKFRLSIRFPDYDLFEQQVINISTPGNVEYGRHISRKALDLFQRPHPMVTEAILETLEKVGCGSIEQKGQWLTFLATVDNAEKLLNTQFYRYYNAEGRSIIRTLEYSVPAEIYEHVQIVQPTTRFGTLKPQLSFIIGEGKAVNPQNISSGYSAQFCNFSVTPDCLRGLYGIGNGKVLPTSSSGTTLGISGFLEQWARHSDLNLFAKSFAPYLSGKNFSSIFINGGQNQQNDTTQDGKEAALDIQYTLALAPSVPVTYYSTGGRGPLVPELDQPSSSAVTNEPYLEQLHYLVDLPDDELPTVLTTSYGEDEQSLPRDYAIEVCRLFLTLGARGVSVIFASGDTGVGSSCSSNDGKNSTKYLPIFPASCPYVTSVGGTTGVEPERAIHFSSGGFSNVFKRPWYQQESVDEYLRCHGNKTNETLYTRAGRAYPDVAAQAANFLIIDKGRANHVSGTSAAAPVFAAIIANINAIRFAAGLPSMGFLSPWLYGQGRAGLTDITEGGSTGCAGLSPLLGFVGNFVPYAGWNATEGWDPVTGLGTPVFQKLAQASLQNMTRWSGPGRRAVRA